MSDFQRVERAVLQAIGEINQARSRSQQIPASLDTELLGHVDSLGLVNLVVAVEEAIEREFGLALTLADEQSAGRPDHPMRSVRTLVEYVERHIVQKRHE
jgi:acyl carrier protein